MEKVVAAGSGVSDDPGEVAIRVEDDAVGSRAATAVHPEAAQDGELQVGAVGYEAEALVIVIGVGVPAAPFGLAIGVKGVTLVDGGRDVGIPIASAAADVDAGLALGGERERGSQGQQDAGEDLRFVSLCDSMEDWL